MTTIEDPRIPSSEPASVEAAPASASSVGESPGLSGRTLTTVVLGALAVPVLFMTLVGFAGASWWVFDVFAGYRFQLGALALVLTAVALPTRRWVVAGMSIVALVVNGLLVAPLYMDGQPRPAAGAPVLTIEHLNMQGTANDPASFIDSLASNTADVIVILEPGITWQRALRDLDVGGYRSYPISPTPGQQFDVIVVSRITLRDVRRPADPALPTPSVQFSVRLGDRDIEVMGMHTLSPKSGSRSAGRDRQLEAVTRWANARHGPAVVLGDLNSTPWSHSFRDLLSDTSLRNSQDGYGFEPTWPVQNWFLRVPIDQSLYTPELTVVGRSLGSGFGSSHRSLTVRYSYR